MNGEVKSQNKKWALIYIPTGDILFARTIQGSHIKTGFDIYLNKNLAVHAAADTFLLSIKQKSRPKTTTFIHRIDKRLSRHTTLTLLDMVSMDFPREPKSGRYIELFPTEFEVVEVLDHD